MKSCGTQGIMFHLKKKKKKSKLFENLNDAYVISMPKIERIITFTRNRESAI